MENECSMNQQNDAEEISVHTTKCKKAIWKGDRLCNSNYVVLSGRWNYGDSGGEQGSTARMEDEYGKMEVISGQKWLHDNMTVNANCYKGSIGCGTQAWGGSRLVIPELRKKDKGYPQWHTEFETSH